MHLVDPRAGRVERGVVAVVLLAGFVFGEPIAIPIATILAIASTTLGDRSPTAQLWTRSRGSVTLVPIQVSRAESALIAALLVLATLIVIAGSVGLGVIPAMVAAAAAALDATGVFSPVAELRRRRHS